MIDEQVLKPDLPQLIALQNKDTGIDAVRQNAARIPDQINEQTALLAKLKSDLDDSKKQLLQLQLQKKEKEMELAVKEGDIQKHNKELNSLRTNDAYKAMLSEIETGKRQKSAVEDDILNIMEKIEQEAALAKAKDATFKQDEARFKEAIAKLEAEKKQIDEQITGLEKEREEFAKTINPELLKQYEFIRSSKHGKAVVPIENATCGGCHIELRQQTMLDVAKEKALVFCDDCARILYQEKK